MKRNKIFARLFAAALCLICMGAFSGCGNNENKGTENAEITFSANEIVLVAGHAEYGSASLPVTATANGKDVSSSVTFTSADTAVATVENGVVTAAGAGFTEITAKYGNAEKTISVSVLRENAALDVTDKTQLNWYGRIFSENGAMCFYNTATGFETSFIGTRLSASLTVNLNSSIAGLGALRVYVDGVSSDTRILKFDASQGSFSGTCELVKDLPMGIHTVKVIKMTEQGCMRASLGGLTTDGTFLSPKKTPDLRLEFYGDSITGGYGNLGEKSGYQWDEDSTYTYATLATEALGAQASMLSYSGIPACLPVSHSHLKMVDAFDKVYLDAPDTMPKYDFSEYPADVVVINLGTNDTNSPALDFEGNMYEGYKRLLQRIHAARPQAAIVCVYGMMGVNKYIDKEIAQAVDELDATGEYKILYQTIRTTTSGVAGHPDREGHETAAAELAELIRRVL
ncbi:MAG: hypothetical protein HFE47_04105 [Clostridia bacterium]|nr:hypothetical protein [Clostridia bacterium]